MLIPFFTFLFFFIVALIMGGAVERKPRDPVITGYDTKEKTAITYNPNKTPLDPENRKAINPLYNDSQF